MSEETLSPILGPSCLSDKLPLRCVALGRFDALLPEFLGGLATLALHALVEGCIDMPRRSKGCSSCISAPLPSAPRPWEATADRVSQCKKKKKRKKWGRSEGVAFG